MAGFIFEDGSNNDAASFTSSDTLVFRTSTPSQLTVTYTAASGLTVDTITISNGVKSLTFAASALTGTSSTNRLTFLAGGGGTLTIGTTGADATLSATADATSSVYGLAGNDTIAVSGKGAHVVDGGAGVDSITATTTGNYVLSGGADGDTIDASGATGNLHIYGNAFGSVAGAVDGADTITVGHGTGTTAATNYVNGNAGNDTISVAAGGIAGDNYRLFGGAGDDTITAANAIAGSTVSINGNTGDDTITGGAGNNILRGGQGADILNAGTGNSQLFGDAGNDTLNAGVGNNITVMTGGADADKFIFAAGAGSSAHINPGVTAANDPQGLFGYVSEIKDFTSGTDQIGLANVTTTVSANILLQASGTTFTNAQAALVYAQQVLDNNNASETATKHNVVLIQVGSDTYLFSHDATATVVGTSGTIDTAIKLDGVTAANVKASDFI